MRNKTKWQYFILPVFVIWIMIGVMWCVYKTATYRAKEKVVYWASYQDGHRVRVEDLVVIPMMGPNDVNGIWPEYYAEKEVQFPVVEGVRLVLRSRPFILSENPKVQGKFGERMVYFVPDQGR